MKKIALSTALAWLGGASLSAYAAEWYEGGTLKDTQGSEWLHASEENKIASAGELLIDMYDIDMLDTVMYPGVESVDDLRPYAERLVMYTDKAVNNALEDAESPEEERQVLSSMETPLAIGVYLQYLDLGTGD